MKKFLLTACLIMFISALHAQDNSKIYTPNRGKKIPELKVKPYTTFNPLPFAKRDTSIQTMPVVGKIKPPVYVFNNGKGFDVYQSPLDQMLIPEPDSTFQSNMRVKKSYMVKP